MIWEPVGKRIKNLRQKQELSRGQFGKMVGISGQHLGLVEKGSRGLSVESIVKLCATTGISADYLLFGADIIEDPAMDMLSELSDEQIGLVLEIIKRVALFVNTEDGNEALIKELCRRKNIKEM